MRAPCINLEAMVALYMYMYVTASEKIDHFAQISDIEILVPHCSALFTLRNGEVRIAISYTVLE